MNHEDNHEEGKTGIRMNQEQTSQEQMHTGEAG